MKAAFETGTVTSFNIECGFGFVQVEGYKKPFRIILPNNGLGENERRLPANGPLQVRPGSPEPFFINQFSEKFPTVGDLVMVHVDRNEITHWCRLDEWTTAQELNIKRLAEQEKVGRNMVDEFMKKYSGQKIHYGAAKAA